MNACHLVCQCVCQRVCILDRRAAFVHSIFDGNPRVLPGNWCTTRERKHVDRNVRTLHSRLQRHVRWKQHTICLRGSMYLCWAHLPVWLRRNYSVHIHSYACCSYDTHSSCSNTVNKREIKTNFMSHTLATDYRRVQDAFMRRVHLAWHQPRIDFKKLA